MKLDEITNSNYVWGTLLGTDFSRVNEYNTIISLLKMLISLQSKHRVLTFIHTINVFEDVIEQFIENDYGNYPNQQDIKRFKNKCKTMLSNVRYLKSKLP